MNACVLQPFFSSPNKLVIVRPFKSFFFFSLLFSFFSFAIINENRRGGGAPSLVFCARASFLLSRLPFPALSEQDSVTCPSRRQTAGSAAFPGAVWTYFGIPHISDGMFGDSVLERLRCASRWVWFYSSLCEGSRGWCFMSWYQISEKEMFHDSCFIMFYLRACVYACVYVRVFVRLCTCMRAFMYVCPCACGYVFVCRLCGRMRSSVCGAAPSRSFIIYKYFYLF